MSKAQYTKAGAIIDGKQTSVALSNVARIGHATLLEDEENGFEQIVYYQAGIGADQELTILQSGLESASGKGLISNIRTAYGFICENYDYDDEIYITGFSRGAYTARSVAGLIGKCGLLTKSGLKLFYEAFEYYQLTNKYKEQHRDCPVSEAVSQCDHVSLSTMSTLMSLYRLRQVQPDSISQTLALRGRSKFAR